MRPVNETPRTERVLFALIVLLGGVGLVYGWRLFWFLTDDAFIAFRYISNSQLGHGYVWNAPPFLPIEGYTSFLWIVLLDGVWRTVGVEPPDSANWIALGFSYGILLLGSALVLRIRWHSQLVRFRLVFVVFFVLFMVFNRTFLAWSSSGLETAMMDFLLLLWVYVLLGNHSPSRRACLGTLTAACMALTRPDGLLFCGATLLAVCQWAFAETERRRRRRVLIFGLLPLCIVLVHQAWRLSFYGAWVPNTYYAKVTGSWPESGFRYLLSFAFEYALWFAGFFVCWALLRSAAITIAKLTEYRSPGRIFPILSGAGGRTGALPVVVGALFLHFAYYTYVVGGDHFEYRVYAHLIPLSIVALLWSLNRLRVSPVPAIAVTSVFVLLSMPVQWTHWALTKDLSTRQETHVMRVPIAPHWPKPVRWYAQLFDGTQSWLIRHHVCMRHQEHKVFWQVQTDQYPSRDQGLQISEAECPVLAVLSVGVPSWVLPHVYVIDTFGLNDYVIAHTPASPDSVRLMAHSRLPPKGYVESYRPNVQVRLRKVIIKKRFRPLTIEQIAENERYWRERVDTIEHGTEGDALKRAR